MSASLCVCGHDQDAHDEESGMCDVQGCRCVVFRDDDGWEENEDDDVEELDFDIEEE